MTELAFSKTFLTTLDNKSTKYQPDHVFNPETFELRTPYVLPKLPHPQHPPPPQSIDVTSIPAPGATKATTTTNTLNITLKSTKNPSFSYSLTSTPPSTTISSIKEQLHTYLGGSSAISSIDKIKILLNKKPVPSSKETIADLADADTKDLELGVMVMGGAPDPPPQAAGPGSENAAVEATTGENPEDTAVVGQPDGVQTAGMKENRASNPVQPDKGSGKQVLETKEFWSDLEGFLTQRIRNQKEAEELRKMFESAWRTNTATP